MREVTVELFGKQVKVINDNGDVKFDMKSFAQSVGKARSERLFGYMDEAFAFIGKEGVDDLVSKGKEYMLCQLVLIDKNSPDELRQYAEAWATAYELLVEGE